MTRLRHFTSNYSSTIDIAEIQRLINTNTNTDHPQFCQLLVDCLVPELGESEKFNP